MDAKQLDDWEALAKAATEGPWAPFPSGILHGPTWVVSNVPQGERGRIMRDEDAAFIAAARDAVPELVEEVRRLRAQAAPLPPLYVCVDPNIPPGTAAMLSGDQVLRLHNLHSEDMLKARRFERERCAKVADAEAEDARAEHAQAPESVALRIAATVRALPDEPSPEET